MCNITNNYRDRIWFHIKQQMDHSDIFFQEIFHKNSQIMYLIFFVIGSYCENIHLNISIFECLDITMEVSKLSGILV